ncbi:tetratricopeptide repeat protein [bacterium]|nr:tetratricopeptide repeat protein [bacterium]MBU1984688.1 tetratricopeptide repeat protein [bacterium]
MLKSAARAALVLVILAVAVGCKTGPSQAELFDRAKKAQEESNFAGAVEAYQEIVKRFPSSPEAPQCQFMIGYLYANHLNNMDMAGQAYQKFIRDYPEHDLVKDAQWELDHLGKDVNEIEELNQILTRDSAEAKADTAR